MTFHHTTLRSDRVRRSVQMILVLAIAAWGLVFLAVKIGMSIVATIGGAL